MASDPIPGEDVYEALARTFHDECQDVVHEEGLDIPGHRPHDWSEAHPAYRAMVIGAMERMITHGRLVRIGVER